MFSRDHRGWAAEISLDVEWRMRCAEEPGVLLVEANSATNADLLTAVKYAKEGGWRVGGLDELGRERVRQLYRRRVAGERMLDSTFETPAKQPE